MFEANKSIYIILAVSFGHQSDGIAEDIIRRGGAFGGREGPVLGGKLYILLRHVPDESRDVEGFFVRQKVRR